MSKKDYSKLRPFDLEAAKRGELLTSSSDISQGNPIWKYAAGPDSHGMIIATVLDDGHFANPASTNAFRMAPLAWVRASADDDTLWPVYKGDVLWHSCGKCEALGFPTLEDHDLLIRADGLSQAVNAKLEFLTFSTPKVKRQIKLVAFIDDQGDLRWVREELFANRGLRVPLEDRMVEVEEPAGQEGGSQ